MRQRGRPSRRARSATGELTPLKLMVAAGCNPGDGPFGSWNAYAPGAAAGDSAVGDPNSWDEAAGAPGQPDPDSPGVFVDVAVLAGVTARHAQLPENPATLPCNGLERMAGGAAIADFDNDGAIDIFMTRLHLPNLLYRNNGDGTFQEVGGAAGVDATSSSAGATWGDVDADGDLDLYVTTYDRDVPPMLYINGGDGAFTEEAQARGVALFAPPDGAECTYMGSASFVDYDLDGDLDLHVNQWHRTSVESSSYTRLLANDGTGHFVDVTVQSGLDPAAASSFTSTFADVDNDGDPDALLTADFGTSSLYLNNGDGTFADHTVAAGIGTEGYGMGASVADFDDDGDFDWFVTSIYRPGACGTCDGNRLYLNDGNGVFADRTGAAGVRDGGWPWGTAFFDFDGDGDLDLALTNGFGVDYNSAGEELAGDPLRLWENSREQMEFAEVSSDYGFVDARQGRSLVPFDYDNDGDLDLFIVNMGETPALFRNNVANGTSWLRVQLRGHGPNRFGIGARVELQATPNATTRLRQVHLNATYLGSGPPEAHFGLGAHQGPIHEVRVSWPGAGSAQLLNDIMPGQILVIEQPQ